MASERLTGTEKQLNKLIKLLFQKKYGSAIKEGMRSIQEFPHEPFFYIGVAIANSELGNIEIAFDILKKAEKKFPDNYELLFQLGKMYEEQYEFTKAIQYFFKSFDATPEESRGARADCYNDIGAILSRLGKGDEAEKLWKEALKIDPANVNVKYNLKQKDTPNIEEEEEEEEMYSDFLFYQMNKYFRQKGKLKFSSEKEQENFDEHISDAYLSLVLPRILEIQQWTDDERASFLENIEIDFSKPAEEITIPKLGKEISEHLLNVYPFLPEDGVIMIMIALPALEYAGISEETLENFLKQTETPNGEQTRLLKWAYNVGKNLFLSANMKKSKKKKQLFDEIINNLNQELDENDSLTVMDSIISRIENPEDFIS